MAAQTVGDGSFAAYVAARWSMLYRLATLLAGAEDADRLTRAALVRASLSWADVQQSATADVAVKQILAGTVVKDGAARVVTEHDGAAEPPPHAGRARLWALLGEVLPRQRAMLVLRHHEGLSDAEIAEALSCSRSTVAAESLALETGIDLTDLRAELVRRSEDVTVPHPPIDELVASARQAGRDRRRRAWGWAAGLAALVAGGLVLVNVLEGTADRSDPRQGGASVSSGSFLSALPSGPPPRIAYSVGRSLHLGSGREIVLPERPSSFVQTRKWLYASYLSGKIVRVDITNGEISTVADTSQGGLVTDAAGAHLAWLAAGRGPAVVEVETVTDWVTQIGDRQRFPARPRCCDNPFVVNGITQDGDVIASLPAAGRAWVWHTPDAGATTDVRAISGLDNGEVIGVATVGVVVRLPSTQYAVGRVDHGRFFRTALVTAANAEFDDPLGHRLVYVDEDGGIHVRELRFRGRSRRGAQDVQMLLPAIADGFASARWEDADHVLLDVSDESMPRGALVRCAVRTGACETAVRFDRPHLVAD